MSSIEISWAINCILKELEDLKLVVKELEMKVEELRKND